MQTSTVAAFALQYRSLLLFIAMSLPLLIWPGQIKDHELDSTIMPYWIAIFMVYVSTRPKTALMQISPAKAEKDKADSDASTSADSPRSSATESPPEPLQFDLDSDSCDLDSSEQSLGRGPFPAVFEAATTFTVAELLKERRSVPWLEGIEERSMVAEAVDESSPSLNSKPTLDFICRKSEEKKPAPDEGAGAEALQVSKGSFAEQMAERRRAREEASKKSEAKSDEEVIRAMKSILNKLTIEKFTPLSEKLISCGIETMVHLDALVSEVLQKATTQHHFIDMYADLCMLLHTHFVDHPIKTTDSKFSFKSALLHASQSLFEKGMKPPPSYEDLDEEQRNEMHFKYKLQVVGNIKFMGALLVRKLLNSKLLFAICEELMEKPTSESLESLATLLTGVGPTFDVSTWPSHKLLADVFKKVKLITKDAKVNSRVRFLLKDVLELRDAGWEDRKPKKIEAPKTLQEVADIQDAEVAFSPTASDWPGTVPGPPGSPTPKSSPPAVVVSCKFGRHCTREECWHVHPHGRFIDEDGAEKGAPPTLKEGATAGATKGSPPPVEFEKCKFGRRCTREGCWHLHPKGRIMDDEKDQPQRSNSSATPKNSPSFGQKTPSNRRKAA